MRRLYTPVIPLLVVWTVLIVVLRPFIPADVVRAGSMSATVPLWFISVYIGLVALAPLTHRWWRRAGLGSIAAIAGTAVAVDIARFIFEVPGIGWVNFLFVWGAVHQLGYWWASRDAAGRAISPATGWAISGTALTALIAVTWIGWYPVAMVGIPGAELTNMTPPTFAIFLLGVVQAGVILGTQPVVARATQRRGTWNVVVAISGVIMTVYLWHLTAMTIVASIGLFTFGGVAFKIEPGTLAWFLTRPIWVAVLLAVTGVLVAIFARFEWRISDKPSPRPPAMGHPGCAAHRRFRRPRSPTSGWLPRTPRSTGSSQRQRSPVLCSWAPFLDSGRGERRARRDQSAEFRSGCRGCASFKG